MKLNTYKAVTFASALILAVAGCSTYQSRDVEERATSSWGSEQRPSMVNVDEGYDTLGRRFGERAPEPEPAPAPAPVVKATPAPKPVVAEKGSSCVSYGGVNLVNLCKTVPSEAALGEEYCYDLVVTALEDSAQVVVTDTIPAGASYVSSDPAATKTEAGLSWTFPKMQKGAVKRIKVCLKAEKEGELAGCATIHAIPTICASTMVGKPALSIEKSGPATALIGANVTYTIVVSNKGSAVAKNVTVTDAVPAGLSHASGQKQVNLPVGDLAPNQSKTLSITLKADERGKHCNTATAQSGNAGKVSDDACTTVVKPGLKIEKTGTKEQYIGRNADYQIVVSNIGDTELAGVVVTDTAPAGTSIVSADGGTVVGNKVTWNVGTIAAAGKKTFAVRLSSKTAGNLCNSASVAATGGLSDSAEACTLWKGVAAVLLEVVDDPDPLQIGESNTYTIRVTNQGFADINNVKIAALFDEETTPTGSAQGTVSGKSVSFPVVAKLAAKQVITYSVTVKATSVGDARAKITLTCDELKTPVVEEESTTVY